MSGARNEPGAAVVAGAVPWPDFAAASASVRGLATALARVRRRWGPSTEVSAPESAWRARRLFATALVVGALFGSVVPGPAAHADTLLSNSSYSDISFPDAVFGDNPPQAVDFQRVAQPFTTGPGTYGWALESIKLRIQSASTVQNRVEVWVAEICVGDDNLADPCGDTIGLTRPSTVTTGWNTFTAPSGTVLDPSTSYGVVIQYFTLDSHTLDLHAAHVGRIEDSASGWVMPNYHLISELNADSEVDWARPGSPRAPRATTAFRRSPASAGACRRRS